MTCVSVSWCNNEDVLDYAEHCEWFEALRTNNEDLVISMLDEAKEEKKEVLLNGVFNYDTDGRFSAMEGKLVVCRPLNIAAIYASLDVITVLIEHGADVTLADKQHYNIVHCMIANAFFLPDVEKTMVKVYDLLLKLIPQETIRILLLQENRLTLRP